MTLSSFRWTGLHASLCAVALAALSAGCSVDAAGKIPCNDTSNCPAAYPSCSAGGFCVASAAPAQLKLSAGDAQTGAAGTPLASPLVVQVIDSNGNAVPGFAISWSSALGGGTVAASGTTGPDGKASVIATLGPNVGANSFTASAAGLTGSPVTFTATGTPGVAATFGVSFPTSVVAHSTNTATVTAFDAFHNSASYSGSVNVTVGQPDATAVLPKAVALTIPLGGSATVPGIVLGLAFTAQSVIVSDTARPSLTGMQAGIRVSAAASATALVSSPTTSTFGQPVTFTATVTSPTGTGTPGGTVAFTDGTTALGTSVALVAGVAKLTTSALTAGSHTIFAAYVGDLSFAASMNSVSEPVSKAATASVVTLTTGANSAPYGTSLTFTANVTSAGGTPTGTVAFFDGTTSLGAAVPLSAGAATLTTRALVATSVHSITAVFSGDSNFLASTSAGLSQTVTQAGTAVTLSSTLPSSIYGQAVTFNVGVTSAGGTPTGTVAILEGSSVLATIPLSGGAGSVTTALVPGGTHVLHAVYTTDGNFAGGNSANLTQTIAKAATATVVSNSGGGTSAYHDSVTFTATVTSPTTASVAGIATITGMVQFKDNNVALGGLVALNGSAVATVTTTALTVGIHMITADYQSDGNYATSTSGAFVQTVGPAANETVNLASNHNSSVFGQSVMFTATIVVGNGAATATGTVKFNEITSGGTNALSGLIALDSSGSASFSTSALAVGSHSISVSYSGDTNYQAATSMTLTQTVIAAATTVVVVSNHPSVVGQSVTFTATISVNTPGAGTPSGTVTFLDGTTTLTCQGPGTVSANSATCQISTLGFGSHSITAFYSGDSSFAGDTSVAITQTVSASPTSVALMTDKTSSVFGEPVTLTATVSAAPPGAGTPSGGSVTYSDGSTPVSCNPASGSIPTFTCVVNSLGVSTSAHSITAVFHSSDTSFADSPASSAVSVTVSRAATTLSVLNSPSTSVFGQIVTFTATLSITAPGATSGAVVPTGNVVVKRTSNNSTVATCALNGTGTTATCTTSSLAITAGDLFAATYAGDGTFSTSTSSAVTQIVNPDPTSLALSVSPMSGAVSGQTLSFTAIVTANPPGSGTPTGNVTFTEGVMPLCTTALSAGSAGCMASFGSGSHTITAAYPDTSKFVHSTNSITVSVSPASTAVSIAPDQATVVTGQSVTFTATFSVSLPGSGTPTSTITFKNNGTTISGCGAVAIDGALHATCPTTLNAAGPNSITATYDTGDASLATSTSSAAAVTINPSGTTVALAKNVNAPVQGQAVNYTATLSAANPGTFASSAPVGTVTFTNSSGGTTTPCTGVTVTGAGPYTAICSAALPTGSNSLTAVFTSSDGNFSTSPTSSVLPVMVSKASTSTVVSSGGSAASGASVTLTATITVTNPGGGSVAGNVAFVDSGNLIPGCGAVVPSANVASCTISTLSGGTTHPITATFAGDPGYKSSTSPPYSQTITTPIRLGSAAATIVGGPAAGKIFIAGGGAGAQGASTSSFLYDPATSAISAGPALAAARAFHTATAIGDGKVLLAGGNSGSGATFELCSFGGRSPACVATGGSLAAPRCNAAAALVTSSPARVLLAGGDGCTGGGALSSWALWDGQSPETLRASSPANALTEPRALLTATALGDGKVLLAGGGTASADLFTLGSSASIASLPRMSAGRSGHTATLLSAKSAACPSGACVLLAGGVTGTSRTWELFDVASGSFGRPPGALELTGPRSLHAAALLADGRLLLAGGTNGAQGLSSTELFDPATSRFTAGLPLQTARAGAAAAYVPSLDLLLLSGGSAAEEKPELITAP